MNPSNDALQRRQSNRPGQRLHPDAYHAIAPAPSLSYGSTYGNPNPTPGQKPVYGVHPGMFANPNAGMPLGAPAASSHQGAGRTTPASLRALGLDLNEFEAPYAREFQQAVDWCQIRHNIIRVAVEIQGDWLASGGNLMTESNPAVREMLIMFWRDGVGMSQSQAEAVAYLSAADHPTQAFWSAAFISWCVRSAMPNPPPPNNGGFHYHMRHMVYIAQALRNRENADATRPFWLYDINEPNIVPEDGDLLCLNRSGTNHSYQSVRRDWVVNNPNAEATGSSHTDIVIGHFEESGRRWIETIGGNVGDTVGSRYYSLDAQGRLVDEVTLNGTSKSGKSNVTQQVGSRSPVVFSLIRLTACPNN